jgi:flagellar motor switch protein FliN/FliY
MPGDDKTDLSVQDVESLPEGSSSPDDQEGGVVYDIPVKVSIVLGTTSLQVRNILYLNRGAVLELDRKVGDAIDIIVNNRLVARGEVNVFEDRLGLIITEVIKVDNLL